MNQTPSRFQPCRDIRGITFWRQVYPNVPRFNVFKVCGVDFDTATYLFQNVKTGGTYTLHALQLGRFGFEPFLIPGGREAASNASV